MTPSIGALFQHVIVGGLWHPVKRRAEAELIVELHRGRLSSFPFVSPDTFRSLCDLVIEDGQVLERQSMALRHIVFFRLSEINGGESSYGSRPSLEMLDHVLSNLPQPPVLIMAYGDLLPAKSLMDDLVKRSHFVFAVNIIEETEKLQAIPIGLQNMSRNRNGRLAAFLDNHERRNIGEKSVDVFTAFEPENNPIQRGKLVRLLASSTHGWNPKRLSPETYRQMVSKSLFVLSPLRVGVSIATGLGNLFILVQCR